jgi:cyclohexanone monooxygenase
VKTTSDEYQLDTLIFATGFDAMTGALLRIDIRGRDGRSLKEKWSGGPLNYLGLAVSGFPNLLMITGPGSPSVLANVVIAIELHVEWIADLIGYMRKKGHAWIDPEPEAEALWVEHVNAAADATLYGRASSWYRGANVPGKPQVFMPYVGGLPTYLRRCCEVESRGYDGFRRG